MSLKEIALTLGRVLKYGYADARWGLRTDRPRVERALQQAYRETYAYTDGDTVPGPNGDRAAQFAFWQRNKLQDAMNELGIEIPERRDYDLDTDELDGQRP